MCPIIRLPFIRFSAVDADCVYTLSVRRCVAKHWSLLSSTFTSTAQNVLISLEDDWIAVILLLSIVW